MKSVFFFWNSRRMMSRMQEIMTTIPPREMMDMSIRRLRREAWIAQRDWIGRMTMRTSTKIDCFVISKYWDWCWAVVRHTNAAGTKARTELSIHLTSGWFKGLKNASSGRHWKQ